MCCEESVVLWIHLFNNKLKQMEIYVIWSTSGINIRNAVFLDVMTSSLADQ